MHAPKKSDANLRGRPELVWLARQLNLSLIPFACVMVTFVLLFGPAVFTQSVKKPGDPRLILVYALGGLYIIAVVVNAFFLYRLCRAQGLRWWLALPVAAVAINPVPVFPLGVGGALIVRSWLLLRAGGAVVGLRGVSEPEIDALRTRWCQHCGAAREGRPRGVPCPQCRMST